MTAPTDPTPPPGQPTEDLEKALELYLAHVGSGSHDRDGLLHNHPELRELLEPMLTGSRAEVDDGEALGDFRLVRELGRGGMGIVYEAWQRSLDRRVALKLLAPALVASPSAVARFRREAAAAGRLRHPAIVEVYGFANEGDQHFFAMQLVDGVPLHHCADRFRAPATALAVVTQIADALAHAHAAGLVHRDVKPGNILVRADDTAVLTDFGLASDESLPSMTREGGFLGTLDYASPEQVRGEHVDGRTDLWALGVVLYQLLAGRHPFTASTQQATIRNILTAEPPPLRRLVPDLRADFVAVIGRMLEKDPARRYASASALLTDLRALQTGEPVSAREPSAIERVLRWTRREPWRAAALVVLLIGLAATAGGLLLASSRAAQLTGKIHEFDQLATVVLHDRVLAKERDLYPAWPSRIAAMQDWLAHDCGPLLAMRPAIEQTLHELRAQALPPTAAEQAADRQAHPRHAEFLALAARLAALERAQELRRGAAHAAEPALPAGCTDQTAQQLNAQAWIRVSPRPEECMVHGEEGLGLLYARAALAKVDAGDTTMPRQAELATMAWALLANGRDDEARQCCDEAWAATPPGEQQAEAAEHERLRAAIADPPALLATTREQFANLATIVDERRTFRFELESQRFLHDTLTDLLRRLTRLAEHEKHSVEQRLRWAQQVAGLTLHHPRARTTWAEARAAIAAADDVLASRRYRGQSIPLRDEDVIGLVPIGMNPATKLWEFYDLRTAWDGSSDPAVIDILAHAADGSIAVTDTTGIVFVLLPGGTFTMGAQRSDPTAPNHDPLARADEIPHTVTLAPFFLARHELTQGQWARLWNGDEKLRQPSRYNQFGVYAGQPITIANPVEQVDWNMCQLLLTQSGLVLPTEAQWEYGCRANSTTPWACAREDLAHHANLADATCKQNGAPWTCEDWRDGHAVHARVGSFAANAFGLFDMHGNVWEWTLEEHGHYASPMRDGDGMRLVVDGFGLRINRGGSFNGIAALARSAHRAFYEATFHDSNLGVRAARALHPAR